ncbi:MAG: hypothetical protein AAGC78_06740 [Cellvibrio sp.]|uniref:hypothetical protein n=1 Tax=Cellvibrio sp. TaxID=1965322 RepID=UPI0031A9E1BB
MSEPNLKTRFHNEVITGAPESLLPRNLSEDWLDFLLHEFQCMHNKNGSDNFSLLVSAVLKILSSRSGTTELEMTADELIRCLNNYSMELSLEKLNRVGAVKSSSPTNETILTNRVIKMTEIY